LAFCEDAVDQASLDELLRRAQRRQPEALNRLVEIYAARVFGLLYRLTGSRDAAEDLVQETFLRVVRMIGRYQHVGKFESWLFRIAANLARDRARQLGRRELRELDDGARRRDEVRAAEPSGSADPGQLLLRQEAGRRLAECLERLPEADREIILLRHFSELSFREIAEMLGVPLGTALARAHRALKRLRAELADED
jgi:RNA polymerase sigma-70 factor (ECF subfamily)